MMLCGYFEEQNQTFPMISYRFTHCTLSFSILRNFKAFFLGRRRYVETHGQNITNMKFNLYSMLNLQRRFDHKSSMTVMRKLANHVTLFW